MDHHGSGTDAWPAWLRKWGDTLDKGSRFERKFAEEVLARVPGLDPASVTPQRKVTDSHGKTRYIDFAIEEEDTSIAIELDGYDKRGRGPMTKTEFDDFRGRETGITAQGWTFLGFTNRHLLNQPTWCTDIINVTLQRSRLVRDQRASERQAAHIEGGSAREGEYQARLAELDERITEQLERLARGHDAHSAVPAGEHGAHDAGQSGSAAAASSHTADNRRWRQVGIVAAVLVAAAIAAAMLVASGGGSSELYVDPINRDNCPASHPIKGNINLEGERIFHVAGGEFFASTDPERCFAAPGDAIADGFRQSRR